MAMKPKLKLGNLDYRPEITPAQVSENFGHVLKNILIDPYRITKLEEIGRGAQGTVYRVKVAPEKDVFALKELICVDKDELRHMTNELDINFQCKHPNIVVMKGINVMENKVQIVMEYMDFGPLSALVKLKGNLPEVIVAVVAAQILEGINYLQQGREKIAHRDLKPSNILLNSKGDVKIADFGIARKVMGTGGEMGTNVGTNLYMSPERLKGGAPYNSKCDIWSFGLILFECALGRFPFADDIRRLDIREYQYYDFLTTTLQLKFPECFSPLFQDFLRKCLAVRVEERAKASDLMTHPFIEKARQIPRELFVKYLQTIKSSLMDQYNKLQEQNKTQTKKGTF